MGYEKKEDNYEKGDGNLPVLSVKGESIPEAWENSIIKLYENGLWYKRGGYKDKGRLNVDATMTIEIINPLSELFMHKGLNCSWTDLFEYQMEFLGAKDSWVDSTGESNRWPYSYHERLASYPGTKGTIDQIESTIRKMIEKPDSRQHNMITWVPERDDKSQDPPCLQRIWFGLIPDEIADDGSRVLNMNYNFRSRNVMIASLMNMLGLSMLQCYIKDELVKRTKNNIRIGRMVDFNDPYHVSAQDQHLLQGFMNRIEKSKERGETLEDRIYTRERILSMMDNKAWSEIENKIINQTKNYLEGEKLEKEIEKIKKISKLVRETNENLC